MYFIQSNIKQYIFNHISFRKFFRYFRVDFNQPCPFWDDDGMCTNEGCSVCTCKPSEIPETWLAATSNNKETGSDDNRQGEEYGWISNHKSSVVSDNVLLKEQLHLINMEDMHFADKYITDGNTE